MEEEERNKKLQAGKEKLAAFQKKKKAKRRTHHVAEESAGIRPPVSQSGSDLSSTADLSSSSDVPSFDDSDLQSQSEDECPTEVQDAKNYLKLESKLRQTQRRVEELEESLMGKQLALDRVIAENSQIRAKLDNTKIEELESAVSKRDHIIQQLSAQLQSVGGATDYMAEAQQLSQHVQALQSQLLGAGKLLQTQTDKQTLSSQALQEATQEIISLQDVITEKDKILHQLTQKLTDISEEYTNIRSAYEKSRLREKENSEVVQKLMLDAEQMRKPTHDIANGHPSHSPEVPCDHYSQEDVDKLLENLRVELEESHGLQIALMNEEIVKQQEAGTKVLESELIKVREELENANQHFENYKHQMLSDHSLIQNELQSECRYYKQQNDELKNKINTQHDSVVALQEKLEQLNHEKTRLASEVLYLYKDNADQSSEIEEEIAQKHKYADRVKYLEEELEKVNSENYSYKKKTKSLEDTIKLLQSDLEAAELNRKDDISFDSANQQDQTLSETPETSEKVVDFSKFLSERPISDLCTEEEFVAEIASSAAVNPTVVPSLCSDTVAEDHVQYIEAITDMIKKEVVEDLLQAIPPLSESSTLYETCSSGLLTAVDISDINDSDSTVTSGVEAKSTQNLAKLNEKYLAEIENLKSDLQKVLSEKTVAQSRLTQLSDELLVLKGERTGIARDDNEYAGQETTHQIQIESLQKSNTNLMENLQNAQLAIESLENEKLSLKWELESSLQEVIQLLAKKRMLEDEALDLREQLEQIYVEKDQAVADAIIISTGALTQNTSAESLPKFMPKDADTSVPRVTEEVVVDNELKSVQGSVDVYEHSSGLPSPVSKLETDIDHQTVVESVKQLLVRKHELQQEIDNMERNIEEHSVMKTDLTASETEKSHRVNDEVFDDGDVEILKELQRKNMSLKDENEALLKHISDLEEKLMFRTVSDDITRQADIMMANDGLFQDQGNWQETVNEDVDQYSRNLDMMSPVSQDSLEQGINQAAFSQDSLQQEVAETLDSQNALQQEIMTAVTASTTSMLPNEGTISPDSIDGNQGGRLVNVSLDSIEPELCGDEDLQTRQDTVDMVTESENISSRLEQENGQLRHRIVDQEGKANVEKEKLILVNSEQAENLQEMENKLASLEIKISELQAKEKEMSDLKSQNLEEEVVQMEVPYFESPAQDHVIALEEKDSEIKKLKTLIVEVQNDIGDLSKQRNDDLQRFEDEKEKLNVKVKEVQDSLSTAEREKEEIQVHFEEEFAKLKEENECVIRSKEEIITKYKMAMDLERQEHTKTVQDCEAENMDLVQCVKDLQWKCSSLESEKKELENKVDMLSAEIKECQQDLEASEQTFKQAKEKFIIKLDKTQEELNLVKSNEARLTSELKEIENKFGEQLSDFEQGKDFLEVKVEQLREQVKVKDEEKTMLNERISEMEITSAQHISDLKSEIEKFQKSLSEKEKQVETIEKEKNEVRLKLEHAVLQLVTENKDLNENFSSLLSEMKKEKEESKRINSELRCLSNDRQILQAEIQSLADSLQAVKEQKSQTDRSLESTINGLEEAILSQDSELTGLRQMLDSERSEFFNEKDILLAKYKKLEVEYNALKRDNEILSRGRNFDVEESVGDAFQMEPSSETCNNDFHGDSNIFVQQELETVLKMKQNLEKKVDKLKSDLIEAADSNKNLTSQLIDSEERLSIVLIEKQNLLARIEELEQETPASNVRKMNSLEALESRETEFEQESPSDNVGKKDMLTALESTVTEFEQEPPSDTVGNIDMFTTLESTGTEFEHESLVSDNVGMIDTLKALESTAVELEQEFPASEIVENIDALTALESTATGFEKQDFDQRKSEEEDRLQKLNLNNELEQFAGQFEEITQAPAHILKELKRSEDSRHQLARDLEDVQSRNESLNFEIKELKSMLTELKQTLKLVENEKEIMLVELDDHRKQVHVLESLKVELQNKVNELENKNQSKEEEYDELKSENLKLQKERDELLNAHESMVEDLCDMQEKYESVQSLMEDTKKECNKDIARLQSQLCNVNKDMSSLKSSLHVLELSTAGEHCNQLLDLTGLDTSAAENRTVVEQDDKQRKDLQNQRMVSESQIHQVEASVDEITQSQQEADESPETAFNSFESANMSVENDNDTENVKRTPDTVVTDALMAVLSLNANQQDLDLIPESVTPVEHQVIIEFVSIGIQTDRVEEPLEHSCIADYENQIKDLSIEIETLKKECDDLKVSSEFEIKLLKDQLETSESSVEEKVKNVEYSMEEKYAQQFRSKEAELMDRYEKEFKTYKADMENYIKHKAEAIKAEKDQMFIITMRKVKKDYEKRLKKELKKIGHTSSKDDSDTSEGHTEDEGGQEGGEMMGAETEKQILQKEIKELEEARDALLQQVQLTQLHKEQLQEELRCIRGESVQSDNDTFMPENDSVSHQPSYSYPSESLMLDWELTPQIMHDPNRVSDTLEFVEHFERFCDRPQCQKILREYLKLYDYFRNQESRRSFDSSDTEEIDDETGFKPEEVDNESGFKPEEGFQEESFQQNASTPSKSLECGEDIPFETEHFVSEEFRPEISFQPENVQMSEESNAYMFRPESSFQAETSSIINVEPIDTGFKPEEGFEMEIYDDVFESEVKDPQPNRIQSGLEDFHITSAEQSTASRQRQSEVCKDPSGREFLLNTKSASHSKLTFESEFRPENCFEQQNYRRSDSDPVLKVNTLNNTTALQSQSAGINKDPLPFFLNDQPGTKSQLNVISLELTPPLKETYKITNDFEQQADEKAGFKPDLEYQLDTEVNLQPPRHVFNVKDGFNKEEEEEYEERSMQAGYGFKPEEISINQNENNPDVMVATPTTELESVFVRQALRQAAEAPASVRQSRFMSDIPERVGHQQDRMNSLSETNRTSSLHETFPALQLEHVKSLSSKDDKKSDQSDISSPITGQSSCEEDTVDSETNPQEYIEKLKYEKQQLKRKMKDMLKEFTKEKQDMMDKHRQLRLQLENETLSHQHFQQELAELNADINTDRKLHAENTSEQNDMYRSEKELKEKDDKIFKLENEITYLKEKSGFESKCLDLEKKVNILQKGVWDKDKQLKDQQRDFDEECRQLQHKMKEMEESLNLQTSGFLSEKLEMENEIESLKVQMYELTSASRISEDKIDLNKQVDNLEAKVLDLVSEKSSLQLKCKELEDLMKSKDTVIMTTKVEMDKEVEQHEVQVLMLSSANQELEAKYSKLNVKCTELQEGMLHDRMQLEKQVDTLEDHLRTLTASSLLLQERCKEMETIVATKEETLQKSQSLIRTLEDHVCDITATKQDLHLQCTENENEIRNLKMKLADFEEKSQGSSSGYGGISQKDHNLILRKLSKMEKLLEEKDSYILRLEDDLDQIVPSADQQDFAKAKVGFEKTLREQESYIRKLEEHFLRQRFELPSPSGTETPRQQESDNIRESESEVDLTVEKQTEGRDTDVVDSAQHSINVEEDTEDKSLDLMNRSVDTELKLEDLSGQSSPSVGSSLRPHSSRGQSLERQLFTSVLHSNQRSSASSQTGSLDGLEKIRSGLGPDEDGHLALELKHFELVDEISLLRKEMRETKAIYNQENALLREALDRESVKSKLSVSGVSSSESELRHSAEVLQLREKVAVLQETNKMLQIENERWLRRVQDQERIVLELRELLGRDSPGLSEVEKVFGKQISLLQKQRDDLVEKLHDHEGKNERLSKRLGDKNVLEESLRREKELLHAKLCEKEDIERELAEKKLELERQKRSQQQLEEIFYHKNITEKELMRQKRLLEEELSEIECKLQEKEELLEVQKNQLLREIKQKESSPPRFLSGSFSVSFSGEDRLTGHTTLCESPAASSDIQVDGKSQREIGRIEVQLQEMEKEHAVAIQNLKDKMKSDTDAREVAARQRHQSSLSSLKSEQFHKVPE